MDFNIPLESLRCTSCKNFLSHFPIFSDNEVNICGRCPQAEATLHRNSLYEEVAQHLIFPCRYQTEGCFEEIQPEDVPQHEKTCPHKPIECPLAGTCQCEWSGSSRNLLQHCRYKHSTKFLGKDTFNVDLTQSNDNIHLLEHSDSLLMVATRFDAADMLFLCAVYHPRHALENAQFSGQLSLENGNRVMLVRFTTSSSKELCFTEVSLDSLKTRKEELPSLISARIIMGTIEDSKEAQVPNYFKLLSCEECDRILMPPIYQCTEEEKVLCYCCVIIHILQKCKCATTVHVENGSADDVAYKLRSYGLEKLANLTDYDCENRSNGCTFVGKCNQIIDHQELCSFRSIVCLIQGCTWAGTFDSMKFHIEDNHADMVHSNKLKISLKLDEDDERCVFIKNFGLLFHVVIINNLNKLRCTVNIVGNSEGSVCYKFEVINSDNKKNKLTARAPCSKLLRCYFYKSQIKRCLSVEATVDVKVVILKTLYCVHGSQHSTTNSLV